MANYKCYKCNESFRFPTLPKFCPFCGGEEIGRNQDKAKETAAKLITDCNVLSKELETLHRGYIEMLVEYESKIQTLRPYKHRGIINDTDMPQYKKVSLKDALAEYRKLQRKETL